MMAACLVTLLDGDRQDPFLAEPREAEPRDVGLADVVGMARRAPVGIGAEPGRVARHVVADGAALALVEHRGRAALAVAQLPDLGPVAAGLERVGLVEQADDELIAQVGAAEAEGHGDQPPAVAHRAAHDVEARGADEAGLQAVGVGRVEVEEFDARPDLGLAEVEFLGVEVAVVFGELLHQRHRQQRHVARRGELAGVGQAAGVAELRGVHADARRRLGHAHAEGRLRARDQLGEARGHVIGRARHQRLQALLDGDALARPQAELGRRLGARHFRQGHGRGQRQPARLQFLEDEVDRHHLGEGRGMPEGAGIAVQQGLAGVGVDHHVGAGLDRAGRRGHRGDLGARGNREADQGEDAKQ